MTDKEINMVIAKVCGWEEIAFSDLSVTNLQTVWGMLRDEYGNRTPLCRIPDYCHDLNAMHEAERCFFGDWDNNRATDKQFDYLKTLHFVCGSGSSVCSTARQRAEAFLRTIGKWKE